MTNTVSSIPSKSPNDLVRYRTWSAKGSSTSFSYLVQRRNERGKSTRFSQEVGQSVSKSITGSQSVSKLISQ